MKKPSREKMSSKKRRSSKAKKPTLRPKYKFMFDAFEEYAQIMKIDETHPQWEAFKMVWKMARTPSLQADESGRLSLA